MIRQKNKVLFDAKLISELLSIYAIYYNCIQTGILSETSCTNIDVVNTIINDIEIECDKIIACIEGRDNLQNSDLVIACVSLMSPYRKLINIIRGIYIPINTHTGSIIDKNVAYTVAYAIKNMLIVTMVDI